MAKRARIVLLAAQGRQNIEVGEVLGIDRRVAARWRERYLAEGVDGLLHDAMRPGRSRTLTSKQ